MIFLHAMSSHLLWDKMVRHNNTSTLSSSVMEGEILLFSLLHQNTLEHILIVRDSVWEVNVPQKITHYPVTLRALYLTAPQSQVPLLLPYKHGILMLTAPVTHSPANLTSMAYYMLTAPQSHIRLLTLQGESSSECDQWMNSTLLE